MRNAFVTCRGKILSGQIAALEICRGDRWQALILLATVEQNKRNAKVLQAHGEIVRQADRRQNDRINLMRHQILDNAVNLFQ